MMPIAASKTAGGGTGRDMNGYTANQLRVYVARFLAEPVLIERVVAVMTVLPPHVLADFLEDPRFHLSLEDFVPGRGTTVWFPSPAESPLGQRSVVLRRRLCDCHADFAHYVIAHELAHAHLWNGGWGEIADRELAADALAASWGFLRP